MSTPVEYDGIRKLYEGLNSGVPDDTYTEEVNGQEVLRVKFQSGGTATTERNGIFIEDLLILAFRKLDSYNKHLPSRHNSLALTKVEEALEALAARKTEREVRDVYGTEKA